MKRKDPNFAIKVEKAIAEKYGEETVQHPKSEWTNEKEKQYLDDLKKIYNDGGVLDSEQEEVNGVFISKKLLTKESNRTCLVCNTYSFRSNDDVYMSKFGCCETCYIKWIEHRENRWKQ